jgi:hypothetical protein
MLRDSIRSADLSPSEGGLVRPNGLKPALPKLDFRTLLVLSIPGILTWFVLHGSLLAVLPDAYHGADSNSCFDFARKLLTEGDLELAEKRRWLYPLLLAVFGVLPASVLTWSAFFQHGLVLLTTPVAAAVGYHLSYQRSLAAMLLGVLWASGPRLILYCHEVVADSLIPVVFLVAVAAVIFHLRGYRGGWITYAFLFAAIGALLKPHGRPIWLGIVLAIGLTAGPLEFGLLVFQKLRYVLSQIDSIEKLDGPQFAARQKERIMSRIEKVPEEVQLLFELSADDALTRINTQAGSHYSFATFVSSYLDHLRLARSHEEGSGRISFSPSLFGWLILGGLIVSAFGSFRSLTIIFLLPSVLYLVVVYAIGDAQSRYLLPIDWVVATLVVILFDRIIFGIRSLIQLFPSLSPRRVPSVRPKVINS